MQYKLTTYTACLLCMSVSEVNCVFPVLVIMSSFHWKTNRLKHDVIYGKCHMVSFFPPISKKRFLKIKVKCNITSSFELLWYVLTKRECEEKTVDVLYWFWSGSGDTVITCKTLMATAILKTLKFVCYLNHLVNTCIPECNLLLIQKCSLYVLTGAVSERREERVLL